MFPCGRRLRKSSPEDAPALGTAALASFVGGAPEIMPASKAAIQLLRVSA